MLYFFRYLLTPVLLSVAVAGYADTQTKVGLLLPKSGVYAALGDEIESGFRLAIDLEGMEDAFAIRVEDTEATPAIGLARARKLVFQDKVDVLVGVVSSGVLAAMRNFVHQQQVPLIVANAGNNLATGVDCSPYIVRVSFSNAQINRPMGKWMYDQGIRSVYTLAPDYAAGRQMIESFTEAFVAAGGEVVDGEYTPFRRTSDFGPYLARAKASGAEVLYVFYAGGEAIRFVKQYGSFDLARDLPLYGSGFVTSPLYVDSQGDAAVGVTTALHYVPVLQNAENAAFVAAYQEEADRTASEFTVQGYDAAKILIKAIQTANSHSREAIADILPKIAYAGPRGPIRIDSATNNIVQNIYIYKTVHEGEKISQQVIDVIPKVQDQPEGCRLH